MTGIGVGVFLPIAVVLPVYLEVTLATAPHNALLGCFLVLLGVWVPLLLAIFQTPFVLEYRRDNATAGYNETRNIENEMRTAYIGFFLGLSVPLALLLALVLATPLAGTGTTLRPAPPPPPPLPPPPPPKKKSSKCTATSASCADVDDPQHAMPGART